MELRGKNGRDMLTYLLTYFLLTHSLTYSLTYLLTYLLVCLFVRLLRCIFLIILFFLNTDPFFVP